MVCKILINNNMFRQAIVAKNVTCDYVEMEKNVAS